VVDWYVMLFPADRTPRRYARLGERWAAAVGGVVNPNPHVTIAYLVGPAEPAAVVGALRQVPASPVMVEAEGVISYSQTPHPMVDGTFPVSLSRRLRTPLRDATGRAR
jgi:hypothetical protein